MQPFLVDKAGPACRQPDLWLRLLLRRCSRGQQKNGENDASHDGEENNTRASTSSPALVTLYCSGGL